ncbi:MAG TPA: helix-turn-helix transcriptional regulator, partial [Oscillospiraceae bacterium]|nr:helix-turn-helix transcriptional regulator [Oscillospiraceae bacterium]
FILPSSTLPPAKVGKREIEFHQENLIVIGTNVDFLCTTHAPTRQYTNITIQKEFFEQIANEVIGKREVDFSKVKFFGSPQLLRIIADLEFELTYFNNDCAQMVDSIATQMIIQLLRDTNDYTHHSKSNKRQGQVPLLRTVVNPMYFVVLTSCNNLFPSGSKLTSREIEIAAYLLDRFDYVSIAESLMVSPNTVKTHVKHIYDKLKVAGRKELSHKIIELYQDCLR